MNHNNAGGFWICAVTIEGYGENNFGRIWSKNSGGENVFCESIGGLRFNMQHSYDTTMGRQRTTGSYSFSTPYVLDEVVDKTTDSSDVVFGVNGTELTLGAGLQTIGSNGAGAPTDNSGSQFNLGNRDTQDRTADMLFFGGAFFDTIPPASDIALLRAYFAGLAAATLS